MSPAGKAIWATESPATPTELRRWAEDRLKERPEVGRLEHELQIHQVQLEMQNEELRRVQLELAEARDRYLELYEHAPIGYLTLDASRRIQESNLTASTMLGIERRKLVKRTFASLVVPEERDSCHRFLEEAERSLLPSHTEMPFLRPDKTVFWGYLKVNFSNADVSGSPELRVILIDVTERRHVEEELTRLNATLEQRVLERTTQSDARAMDLQRLSAQLSAAEDRERQQIAEVLHDDLQQQLVGLRYRLKVLENTVSQGRHTPDAFEEVQKAISDCHTAARNLCNDLSPPVLRQNGLIAGLEWLCHRMEEQYGLEVSMEVAPEADPKSEVLASVLFRSIRELLLNVHKHSGVSKAELCGGRIGNEIWITVHDTGRGFTPRPVRHMRPAEAGFGLLSIEERLRNLGGRFQVESVPGHGSIIRIVVPAGLARALADPTEDREAKKADDEREATESVGGAAPSPTAAIIRILLTDDHAVIRRGLATLLRAEMGFQVVGEASTGSEALRSAQELRPDVILMDVSMPVMDGIEATERIKRILPGVRIVGLSMFDDPATSRRMIDAGADAFVCKAGSFERLTDAIRGVRLPD
jgi:PAS domain S-box-containing protein